MQRLPRMVRVALLCGVVLALLSPSLRAEFVWDDIDQIVQSEGIRSFDVRSFLGTNVREGIGRGGVNSDAVDLYRPAFSATLAATWAAAGGAAPGAFHLVALLAHLLAVLGVWALARAWLEDRRSWWPEVAALIFALHPATAGAWLFCSAVSEPLAVAGLLGAVLLLDPGERGSKVSWGRAVGAASLFFVALLYKETPLVAAPFLAVWLVRGRLLTASRLAPAGLAAALYLVLRQRALGGIQAGDGGTAWLDVLHRAPLVAADGLFALVRMGPTGLRHLHSEYAEVSLGVAAAAALVVLSVAAVAWRLRLRAPLLPLFVSLHLATLAPVALVATVEGWGGFGRYLYPAWAFGAIALAQVGRELWRVPPGRVIVGVAAVAAVVVGQAQLRQGMNDWSTPEQLALSGVRNAPEVGIHYCWLAQARTDQAVVAGGAPDAGEQLDLTQKCRDLAPGVESSMAYANALLLADRPNDALEVLAAKDERFGPGPRSSILQAISLMEAGRPDEAGDHLLSTLIRAPQDEPAWRLQWEFMHIHPRVAAYRTSLRVRAADEPELASIAPKLLQLLDRAAPSPTPAVP